MRVKKKLNYKFFAVLAAIIVALCSLFAVLPFRKSVSSASAAIPPRQSLNASNKDRYGFSTYTSQMGTLNILVNPTLSLQDVDSSGNSYAAIDIGYNEPIWVEHGFDLSSILYYFSQPNVTLSWVYLALNFKQPFLYNFALSDLYITDPGIFNSVTFYDYNRVAVDATFEEVIVPMSVVRYYKIVPTGNYYDNNDSQKITSIVFKMNGAMVSTYKSFYSNGGAATLIFTLPKGYFANSTDAYNQGYDVGYQIGLQNGDERSYQVGYSAGYDVGYSNGSTASSNLFNGLFFSAIDVPIQSLLGLLDFEIFGVDMAKFALSLFSIALVFSIVRRFI